MKKIPKMSGVLRGNCCEIVISSKKNYEWVYQGEFFNKADAFSERL